MTDMALSIIMFSSMAALSLTYALIMTLLKKAPSMRWFRLASLFALISGAASLGFSMPIFTGDTTSSYLLFSGMLLGLAFLLSLALVLYNRFKVEKTPTFTAEQHKMVRSLAITGFSLYLLHFLALLAGIAGF